MWAGGIGRRPFLFLQVPHLLRTRAVNVPAEAATAAILELAGPKTLFILPHLVAAILTVAMDADDIDRHGRGLERIARF